MSTCYPDAYNLPELKYEKDLSSFISFNFSKGNAEEAGTQRYLHTHVCGSIIHDSQKVEATPVSLCEEMDKQTVVYAYNGLLFSLKKNEILL